jgi:hypothetical protein
MVISAQAYLDLFNSPSNIAFEEDAYLGCGKSNLKQLI